VRVVNKRPLGNYHYEKQLVSCPANID
jgi:hypothetical protein